MEVSSVESLRSNLKSPSKLRKRENSGAAGSVECFSVFPALWDTWTQLKF